MIHCVIEYYLDIWHSTKRGNYIKACEYEFVLKIY